MGYPPIHCSIHASFAPIFSNDERGDALFVPLVQTTFDIVAPDRIALAADQPEPSLAGELWGDSAEASSYRVEPPLAFTKLATDVALVGHAVSPKPTRELFVSLRVGPVAKRVRVVGDRAWVRAMGATRPSDPLQFERMPLCYERAFGGWDRSQPDPALHAFEPRNPVGVGFRAPGSRFEEGVRLPNLEDPAEPIERMGQAVAPCGFGFLSPNWQPRAALAGTFDDAWRRRRMPLMPADFDRRFFNAASAGLVAPGYLAGDEPVVVENASPLGRLSFRLPGRRALLCSVDLTYSLQASIALELDTVIIDTDASRVILQYRGHLRLENGPHDVRAIEIDEGEAPESGGAA